MLLKKYGTEALRDYCRFCSSPDRLCLILDDPPGWGPSAQPCARWHLTAASLHGVVAPTLPGLTELRLLNLPPKVASRSSFFRKGHLRCPLAMTAATGDPFLKASLSNYLESHDEAALIPGQALFEASTGFGGNLVPPMLLTPTSRRLVFPCVPCRVAAPSSADPAVGTMHRCSDVQGMTPG